MPIAPWLHGTALLFAWLISLATCQSSCPIWTLGTAPRVNSVAADAEAWHSQYGQPRQITTLPAGAPSRWNAAADVAAVSGTQVD